MGHGSLFQRSLGRGSLSMIHSLLWRIVDDQSGVGHLSAERGWNNSDAATNAAWPR